MRMALEERMVLHRWIRDGNKLNDADGGGDDDGSNV